MCDKGCTYIYILLQINWETDAVIYVIVCACSFLLLCSVLHNLSKSMQWCSRTCFHGHLAALWWLLLIGCGEWLNWTGSLLSNHVARSNLEWDVLTSRLFVSYHTEFSDWRRPSRSKCLTPIYSLLCVCCSTMSPSVGWWLSHEACRVGFPWLNRMEGGRGVLCEQLA